jgi:sec-independent protein translocase protein TatA
MFGLGGQEIFVVLIVVGLLFGAKKLPELGRSVGEGLREFKKATRAMTGDEETPAGKP